MKIGGDIDVKSQPGKGAFFRVCIPVASSQALAKGAKNETQSATPAYATTKRLTSVIFFVSWVTVKSCIVKWPTWLGVVFLC
jgi:hypothetical protein